MPSGRWLWVGGTDWVADPHNFAGAYNCSSTEVSDPAAFGLLMDLAMTGCGTGAVLESRCVGQLPPVRNELAVTITGNFGDQDPGNSDTVLLPGDDGGYVIQVGDSRKGWVSAYQALIDMAMSPSLPSVVSVIIDISHVRPMGRPLKGFGGVANPSKLPGLFPRIARILNGAKGRQLTSGECCLLIDEAAIVVVSGNIRRSAGIRQFDATAPLLKQDLWVQVDGRWQIDPDRDALRAANHTRVWHTKPTESECVEAVRKQFYSGEGAIQYAPEAVCRASADLLSFDDQIRRDFLRVYTGPGGRRAAAEFLSRLSPESSDWEISDRLQRYGLNPCAEIIMRDNFCNLGEVHLNQIDPFDSKSQARAFRAAALFAAPLLHHDLSLVDGRYYRSRRIDPIVGISFTGLFDFFVKAFGVEWLRWWEAGRPDTAQGLEFKSQERQYLSRWREIVHQTVWDYCDRHGLRRPNRCTTVQPSGTKSLLTGASPGWHPPKAARFIRRITFAKNDPVALACLDYGYSVVPSQSDKDEDGRLLDDPFDPRCTEWLVEIPVAVPWADLPGADTIAIERFSALAQFDFYMQVQTHYTTHNTSATIELRESEIEPLGQRIYQAIQNDEGYISVALLARFDNLETYPRLPFEPISRETYDRLAAAVRDRRKPGSFHDHLARHDRDVLSQPQASEQGPAACDSDRCLTPELY
jgi:ribonucleotide reductase class II